MSANIDQKIMGIIPIDEYTELHFLISPFRGQYLAHIRQYLKTAQYTGYTKRGVTLKPATLESIINILESFIPDKNVNYEQEIGKAQKNRITDVVVRLVKGQKDNYLLDIREYLKSDRYVGWTKKGVRIPVESFDEAKIFLYACWDALIEASGRRITGYIPKSEDKEVTPKRVAEESNLYTSEVKRILGGEILKFPEDFIDLSNSQGIKEIVLPKHPLKLGIFRDGIQYVLGEGDFVLELQNEVEAKYVIYAQLRGTTLVRIPNQMFAVFKAVKEYEKYLQNLQKALIEGYKEKDRNYLVAKRKARLDFEKLCLPWIEKNLQ